MELRRLLFECPYTVSQKTCRSSLKHNFGKWWQLSFH